MASAHFRKMQRQISQLGRSLLPRSIKRDLLELSPRISLRALSYRILCHAEIESYLEERALEIARAVEGAWTNRQHISRSTFCLLAFGGGELQKLPETLQPPPSRKQSDWNALIKPDRRLSRCIKEYTSYIRRQNHGIKEEHLISVLLPIGVDPDLLEEHLVADMTDLGAKRGEAAHAGVSGYVTKGVNPRDEYEQVRRIVDGLRPVDKILDDLLRKSA